MVELRTLNAQDVQAHISELSTVLIEYVQGGASVSFVAGISNRQATEFFENVSESVRRNERIFVAAFIGGVLVGTVHNFLERAFLNRRRLTRIAELVTASLNA